MPLGGEFQPGVRLVEVNPDNVTVEKGGVRQKVMLERSQKAVSSAAAMVVQSPRALPAVMLENTLLPSATDKSREIIMPASAPPAVMRRMPRQPPGF